MTNGKEKKDGEEMSLTPHTLRLLRLITTSISSSKSGNGNGRGKDSSSSQSQSQSEYTRQAISLLAKIASQSHPLILWDILARLYAALTCPDESDAVGGGVVRRNYIALAMEHVARFIPLHDQRNFLMDDHNDNCDDDDDGEYDVNVDGNGGVVDNDAKDGSKEEVSVEEDMVQKKRQRKKQWLKVQDFCAGENITCKDETETPSPLLNQMLKKGRLLLSCRESTFDIGSDDHPDLTQNEHDAEINLLSQLDASVSSHDNGKESKAYVSMQKFMQERVDLQRNILAKRLGLGGILSSTLVHGNSSGMGKNINGINKGTGLLDEMVSMEDLKSGLNPIVDQTEQEPDRPDMKRSARDRNLERIKKRQRLEQQSDSNDNANDDDDDTKGNSQDSTIRKILLLSMDHDRAQKRNHARSSNINSNSIRLITHKTPQTILATDLIFHSFHPSWHIRHGALLGLLALLRAWRRAHGTFQSSDTITSDVVFGKWPQDILARCICVIVLDRFGDYAGPGDFDASNYGTFSQVQKANLHPSNVAPVRDAAAQVLSLLLEMAPVENVQIPCFRVLQYLCNQNLPWEVRHGSMLSFKYIADLGQGYSSSSAAILFNDRVWRTVDISILGGIQDDNDDVKGACAQTVSSLVCCNKSSQKEKELSVTQCFVAQFSEHLWSALCKVQVTSSCALDLLHCLCDLVLYDCELVIAAVRSCTLESSPIEELLTKLGIFLEFHIISIRLCCLKALSTIVEPFTSAILRGAIGLDNNTESRQSATIEGLLKVYCRLISKLYRLLLTDTFDNDQNCTDNGKVEENPFEDLYKSERAAAWSSLLRSVIQLLSNKSTDIIQRNLVDLFRETILSVLFHFFGIMEDTNASLSQPYKIESKVDRYNAQVCAAEALATLCSSIADIVDVNQYLAITTKLMLGSPWMEHCEMSCTLLQAIASLKHYTEYFNFVESCQTPLVDLLKKTPLCLQMNNLPYDEIRKNDIVKNLCEKTLVVALRGLGNDLTAEKSESATSYIFQVWFDIFKKYGVDLSSINDTNPVPASVASMRLNAAIGGAIVSLGSSYLPDKLTPVVRSLVTSIKNENNVIRSKICSEVLASLISSLRLSANSKHDKVFHKVLESVIALTISPVDPETGMFVKGYEQSRMIVCLVVSQIPKGHPLQEVKPLWNRIELLTVSDPSIYKSTAVAEALRLLSSISMASKGNSTALICASSSLIPTVSLLACTAPTAQIRRDAVEVINNFCSIDCNGSLPLVLPCLKKFTSPVSDDPSRFGACTLLNNIVRSQDISLCPYIPHLLPISMSSMTDPLRSAAEISASTFSHLVRLAPLVQLDNYCEGSKLQTISCCWDDNGSKEVVEHLILGKPLPKSELPIKIESTLKRSGLTLRKYQAEGISWMNFLKSTRLNGALCDDMGLGKTLQGLTVVATAHDNEISGCLTSQPKSLVVCPSSLTGQWKNEVTKLGFDKDIMKVLHYAGPKRKERWAQAFENCHLVICSYATLRADINNLQNVRWTYCILDEGHLLKNPKTLTAKAARKLRSKHRLILSGTPIQNNVNELWSVFDWLMPNYLGTESEFTKTYGRYITKGNLPGASSEEIRVGIEKLKHLHQKVLPFILRRKKDDVLKELPSKIITDIPCTMTAIQQRVYAGQISNKDTQRALDFVRNVIDKNSGKSIEELQDDQNLEEQNIFSSLISLRLICTHPALASQKNHHDGQLSVSRFDDSGKLLALNDLLRRLQIFHEEITGADNDESLLYINNEEIENFETSAALNDGADSGIFEQGLCDDTESFSHRKCLIFGQFGNSLDAVEELLFKPHMPTLDYVRIDGKTNAKTREEIVELFQRDPSVKCMLLTSKVGSLGLNLQAADTVIFLENDWNPFVDLQAMDRCHRIGQKNKVQVYRLITTESIEQKIMDMQRVKVAMSEAVVNTENSTMYSMGTDRLLDLFTTSD